MTVNESVTAILIPQGKFDARTDGSPIGFYTPKANANPVIPMMA